MNETLALILVDVQKGFQDRIWGKRNNPNAELIIGSLLQYWRRRGWPVFHIQHLSPDPDSPLNPKRPGSAFFEETSPIPGEAVVTKRVNSAFIGTDLASQLKNQCLNRLVFCGFTTDHCVSTSVRMAKNLGFDPTLVADATIAFERVDHNGIRYDAETVHSVSLASLNREFASICNSKELLEN